MKGLRRGLLGAVAALLAAGGGARAQVFTPTFQGPRASSDVGAYLSDGPGDLAIEGIWRQGFGGANLGLRLGIADTDPDLSLLLGGDLRSPLRAGTAPLDLALTLGLQAVLGDADGLGAQIGLSLGHTFVAAPFTIAPYIHPRLAILDRLGGPDDEETDLDLLADLGVDFGVSPDLILRLGIAFEQPGAGLGFGIAWR